MPSKAGNADPTPGPAKNDDRDHNVIDLAEDRDEVGDKIDRADQIEEQTGKRKLRVARRLRIREERSREPNDIGDDPDGGPRQRTGRSVEPEQPHEHEPHQGERDEQPDDQLHGPDRSRGRSCDDRLVMDALSARPAFLPVADARRPRIGRAIIGAFLAAGLFELFALGVKEFRPLGDHAPWMDDPFDVVTSFAIFFLPIVGALSAVRLALCRRFEPLPRSRLDDLVHGCIVLIGVALVIAGSDWIAVIRGVDRASWSPVTPALVAALAVLTAGLALAAVGLAREARRLPPLERSEPVGPDWLADASELATRVSRRLGPFEPVTTRGIRVVDRWAWAWVRRRPITAAVIAAAGFAALFDVGALREGSSLEVLVFVFGVAWCGMFAFLLAVGSYLGLVRTPRVLGGARRRLLDATLLGCASVPITLAFRDSLWGLVGTSAGQAGLAELDRLLVLVAAAVVGLTFVVETIARIHE